MIQLLGAIAETAASAATVPGMLRVAVDEICRFLNWPVGHAFVPSPTSSLELVSAGIWRLDDPKRYELFRRASKSFPNIHRGMIGRAVAAKRAVQIPDIADKTINFILLDEAKAAGLISGIALPILADGRTIAVLEFYTTSRTELAPEVLVALNQIAHLIGNVAERIQARSVQQHLAAVIEGIVDGVALFDKDERLVLFNRRYAAEVSRLGGLFKPGLKFEDFIRALAKSGYYGPVDENWIQARIRRFRNLEDAEYPVSGRSERPNWISVRHYRTEGGETLIVITDITARKQAEVERITAQQLLRTGLESMSDGVALFDKDERLVLWNENYLAALPHLRGFLKPGVTFPEIIGHLAVTDHYFDVNKDLVETRLRKFRALETSEIHSRNPDGREFWHSVRHYRTRDGGTFLVRTNITERKRAEEALRQSETQLRALIEHAPVQINIKDREGRYVVASPDLLKTWHLTAEQVIGKTALQLYPKDFADRLMAQDRATIASGKSSLQEVIRPSSQGSRVLSIIKFPIPDEQGRPIAIGSISSDITERKQAEKELESSRQLLQTALDSMTDGFALFDKDERLVLFNESYTHKIRLPRFFLKPGITFSEIVANLMDRGGYVGVDKTWAGERIRKFRALEPAEMCLRDLDGNDYWYNVHLYRTRDGGTFLVRTDITQRKQAEAELETSRQLLQIALDSITDGVALFDKDERLVLWNEGFVATSPALSDIIKPGIAFIEMIAQMSARGRYLGVDKDWVETRLRRFRALESTEVHVRDPDGRERWALLQHYRTRDGGTFLVRSDITRRKQAEHELAFARQLLQTALDSMTDGLALFDKEERLVLFNDAYINSAVTVRDFVKPGMTITDIVTHLTAKGLYGRDDKDWVNRRLRQFRALESVEMRVYDPERGERWANTRLYRTRDGGTLLVRVDITERKRAEKELNTAREILQTAIDSMAEGITLFDKDERLVLFNANFPNRLNLPPGFIKLGLTYTELVTGLQEHGAYIGAGKDMVDVRVRQFRDLEPSDLHMEDQDMGEVWFRVNFYRTRDGGTLMVRTDITSQIRAMGEIESARLAAEAASASKSRFLASMSHELRTPLNAILGFAQMLELGLGKMPEEKIREYHAIILRSGQHLLDLVEQILDLSMIENQRAEIRIQELVPEKQAQECVDMIQDEANRRQVEIHDHTREIGSDVRFLGDPTRVRQVMLNLLSNAVKYNRPGGRVAINCARTDGGMIRFSVADTGMGIPEDRRTDVFEPFQRLGREAGQIEGSGIGLALSRQLLLRMGGRIGFESKAGKGSTFWFVLPEAKTEARA